MLRVLFNLIILANFLGSTSMACECDSIGGFKQIIPYTDAIFIVKIKNYVDYNIIEGDSTPVSMKVEIVKFLKGSDERDTVIIWGDNGFSCRPYLTRFKLGEYYLMGLQELDQNKGFLEYELSNCGEFYLDVHGNNVFGRIDGLHEYRHATFEEIIKLINRAE